MKTFNYSAIRNQKWDSDILGLIAAIYKEVGKQELYLKQRPDELKELVEIAEIPAMLNNYLTHASAPSWHGPSIVRQDLTFTTLSHDPDGVPFHVCYATTSV